MPRRLLALLLLVPWLGEAKPWNGIVPGASSVLDVVGKFGEPSRRVPATAGKEVLVYSKEKAVKGTVQALFKCDAATRVVERIDVFPAVVLEAEAIEKTYGPECAVKPEANPCFVRREAGESKRGYYLYAKLGLAVFFQDDGKTVQSMAFLSPKD